MGRLTSERRACSLKNRNWKRHIFKFATFIDLIPDEFVPLEQLDDNRVIVGVGFVRHHPATCDYLELA